MEDLLQRFDIFCKDIIAQYRIDITYVTFENETDKEVFVIKHLITVMHELYKGVGQYITYGGNDHELKSIASHYLQQYTDWIYQSFNE